MNSSSRIQLIGVVLAMSLLGLVLASTHAKAQSPDQVQLEQGARLYAENCAVCHGPNGEGRIGATVAKDWPTIRPDLLVRTTIENGIANSPMPAWSLKNSGPFTDGEIDALVAYILSWEIGGPRIIPATLTPVPRLVITPKTGVEGDPNRGAVLYDQNCAVCHGPFGEGRVGVTLAKALPALRTDLRIRNTISEGIENSVMPAWNQSNGGPLTETDIDDVTAFVITLADIAPQISPTATPVPTLNTLLTGWGGVILILVAFALIIGIIILVQTHQSE